jgi:tetratricopeptide (TPR) repeat protein
MHLCRPKFAARVWTLVVALMAAGSLARAQDADDEQPGHMNIVAKQHLDAGLKAYREQDYATAIDEFRMGYEIDPRPDFLYAKAQAERMSGNCAKAIRTYEAFLNNSPPARQVEPARQNIARCKEELGGRKKGGAVAARGDAAPAATATEGASAEGGTPWYKDAVGDALLAAGVGALVGGGLVWKGGRDDAQAAAAATSYSGFATSAEGADTRQTIGVVAMAAGGALVAGAIVRYMLHHEAAAAPAQVAPVVQPGAALVVFGARF